MPTLAQTRAALATLLAADSAVTGTRLMPAGSSAAAVEPLLPQIGRYALAIGGTAVVTWGIATTEDVETLARAVSLILTHWDLLASAAGVAGAVLWRIGSVLLGRRRILAAAAAIQPEA